MSKILLIKPRFFDGFFHTAITQPIGLMYIGATLKKAGHETKIHDCALDYKDLHILQRTLMDWKPDFIGISIIVTEIELVKKIMKMIRDILPHVPVTFGGPWPSANPDESIKTFGADFVVLGEGELVFPQLIDAINNGLPTESIPGTASFFNGHIKINEGRYLTEDELNTLPFPAWELLDHNLYANTPSFACAGNRPHMTVITSRGCPFKCIYCHQTMGKVFRKKSSQSVLAELEELRFRHGFKEFEIIDDCFNLDRQRMHDILTGIRDRIGDIKLHFPNALRSDMLKPEDAVLFKQAGTVSVVFAIETSSPRLQRMIKKNLNLDKAVEVMTAAVNADIYCLGYFMMGFPTESYEEASATVKFAARSKLHRAFFFNPTPLAGTQLAAMSEDILKERNYTLDPRSVNYFTTALNISAMTDHELQSIFRNAYWRFYLNPNRIIRLLKLFIRRPELFSIFRILKLFTFKIIPRRRITA
ncbi:MAG: B12-binding domain-containing radical SAM protein [Syntrophaceae bacterium]|nr:B12-binding domain-containing radical SAM protein [Syntrophaceae bacterium]